MKRKDDSVINNIARALKQNPGLTGAELSEKTGNPNAYRRLSEIKRLGLARKDGERKCTVTGKMAALWYPDDVPPEPDRGELRPRDEIKRLQGRIAYLEKELARFKSLVNENGNPSDKA